MNNYQNVLRELDKKGTNYLVKLNIAHELLCWKDNDITDDVVNNLYNIYIKGWYLSIHDFVREIIEYCKDKKMCVDDLTLIMWEEYLKESDYE